MKTFPEDSHHLFNERSLEIPNHCIICTGYISYEVVEPHHDTGSFSKLPADFTDNFLSGSANSGTCPGTEQINEHGSQQASYKHFWDCDIHLNSETPRIFYYYESIKTRPLEAQRFNTECRTTSNFNWYPCTFMCKSDLENLGFQTNPGFPERHLAYRGEGNARE